MKLSQFTRDLIHLIIYSFFCSNFVFLMFVQPVHCRNIRHLDDTSEFSDLMSKEGDIVLDRPYTVEMDKWNVITPNISSLEGKGMETVITLNLRESHSIRLFSQLKKVTFKHIYFRITHESDNITIINSLIDSINECSFYDIHIYLPSITTISTLDKVYGLFANEIRNGYLFHVGLYFNNLTITSVCDTFGLLIGKVVNSNRREYLGLFTYGNDIKMKDIPSTVVHFGLVVSSTENLDISYSFIDIKSIDVSSRGILRLGGIISIPEDDVSFYRCYAIIRTVINVVDVNYRQNFDDVYIGGLLAHTFKSVFVNDSYVDIHVGKIQFYHGTMYSRRCLFGGLIGIVMKASIVKNVQSIITITDNITSSSIKDHYAGVNVAILVARLDEGSDISNSYLEFNNITEIQTNYFSSGGSTCFVENSYIYSTYADVSKHYRMQMIDYKEKIQSKLSNYEYDNKNDLVYHVSLPYFDGERVIDKYKAFREVDIICLNNEYLYDYNGLFAIKNENLGNTFEIKSEQYSIQIFAKEDKTCFPNCTIKFKSLNSCYYPLKTNSVIYPSTSNDYLSNNKYEMKIDIMNCRNKEYISNYTIEYEIYDSGDKQLLLKDSLFISVINNRDTKDFLYLMNNETNIYLSRNYSVNVDMVRKFRFEPKFRKILGKGEKSFLKLQFECYEDVNVIDIHLFYQFSYIEIRGVYISIEVLDKRIDKQNPMEVKIYDKGLFTKISYGVLDNIHIYLPPNFSLENRDGFSTLFTTELIGTRVNHFGVFFNNLTVSSSFVYEFQYISLVGLSFDGDYVITGMFVRGETLNIIVKPKQNIYIALIGNFIYDYKFDSSFVDIEKVNIYNEGILHFCLLFSSIDSGIWIKNSFGIIRKSLVYHKYTNNTNFISGFADTLTSSIGVENSWISINFGLNDFSSSIKGENRTLFINGLIGESKYFVNFYLNNVQSSFIFSDSFTRGPSDKIYISMLTEKIKTLELNNSYISLIKLNGIVDLEMYDVKYCDEQPKINNSYYSTSGDIDMKVNTRIIKDSIENIKGYLKDYELSDDNELLYYKYMPFYNRRNNSLTDKYMMLTNKTVLLSNNEIRYIDRLYYVLCYSNETDVELYSGIIVHMNQFSEIIKCKSKIRRLYSLLRSKITLEYVISDFDVQEGEEEKYYLGLIDSFKSIAIYNIYFVVEIIDWRKSNATKINIINKGIINRIENSFINNMHVYLPDKIRLISENDNSINGIIFNEIIDSSIIHIGLYFSELNVNVENDLFGIISGIMKNNKDIYEMDLSGVFVSGKVLNIEREKNSNNTFGILFGELNNNIVLSNSIVKISFLNVNNSVKSGISLLVGKTYNDITIMNVYILISSGMNIKNEQSKLEVSAFVNENENKLRIIDCWFILNINKIETKDEIEITNMIGAINANIDSKKDGKMIEIVNSYGRLNLTNNISTISSSSKLIKYGLLFGNIKDDKNRISIRIENSLIDIEEEKGSEDYLMKDILFNTGDISITDKEIIKYYIISEKIKDVEISIPLDYNESKKVMDRNIMMNNLDVYLKDYDIEDREIFYIYNLNYNTKRDIIHNVKMKPVPLEYADMAVGYGIDYSYGEYFYIRSMISDRIIHDNYVNQSIVYIPKRYNDNITVIIEKEDDCLIFNHDNIFSLKDIIEEDSYLNNRLEIVLSNCSSDKEKDYIFTITTINGDKEKETNKYTIALYLPKTEIPSSNPTTSNPTTSNPTTSNPTTSNPTTSNPTTSNPTTSSPTTSNPTTLNPTTSSPTTSNPTTSNPTTSNPTTSNPTTSNPTTSNPTTLNPTTLNPTTLNPTTSSPTTSNPTTSNPTTSNPTTSNPTTSSPTTSNPTTSNPTTPNPNRNNGNLNTVELVGIIVGAISSAVFVVFLFIFCYVKRCSKRKINKTNRNLLNDDLEENDLDKYREIEIPEK